MDILTSSDPYLRFGFIHNLERKDVKIYAESEHQELYGTNQPFKGAGA